MEKEPNHILKQRPYSSALLLILFAVLQVLIVAISFIGGYMIRDGGGIKGILPAGDFPVLLEAYNILKDNAYLPLPDAKKLEYGMIRGMLREYDEPYTTFVEPPQHELQTNQLQGHFGGIGVRIERDAESYVYLYPLPDSPSSKAGILEGDRLLGVDNLVVTPDTPNDEIQAAVRGPVGEKVKIKVGRPPSYTPIELWVERADVPLPSITWNLAPEQPEVGLVQIHVIADTTPDEVTKAIQDLQRRGASLFVIDVRNNGGGLVEAGVNTARLFLKEGSVIEQQYRGQKVKTFTVDQPGPFVDIPMVVLVNKGTASAAEIFAGAIQGQKRAPVVGSATYGKDSIQLVFNLSDGSSLHVTAAQWWVPGLEPKIGGNGLQPDVAVAETDDANAALQKAIETILK